MLNILNLASCMVSTQFFLLEKWIKVNNLPLTNTLNVNHLSMIRLIYTEINQIYLECASGVLILFQGQEKIIWEQDWNTLQFF